MKKNLVLTVALIALVGFSAFAQDAESDFQVTKAADGKSVSITKYVGKNTTVNIPSKIQNLPVTAIGIQAFRTQGRIISVIIPEGVTTIFDKAFELCSSLETITIAASVSEIRTDAFAACNMLKSVTFLGNNSKGVAVNVGFYGDLREKYLAGGPGTYKISGSTWTKQAATAAPANTGTPGLEFTLINNNKEYSVSKGTVENGAVVIPASYNNLPVTTIADRGFERTSITSVNIPNSVKTIGVGAFVLCASLTNVTIPNSVNTIGGAAFGYCSKLTSITIPSSVTKIDNGTFSGCSSLTSVTFAGQINTSNFTSNTGDTAAFPGDLRDKFYATDKTKGTAGTYTRPNGTSTTWTKK